MHGGIFAKMYVGFVCPEMSVQKKNFGCESGERVPGERGEGAGGGLGSGRTCVGAEVLFLTRVGRGYLIAVADLWSLVPRGPSPSACSAMIASARRLVPVRIQAHHYLSPLSLGWISAVPVAQ